MIPLSFRTRRHALSRVAAAFAVTVLCTATPHAFAQETSSKNSSDSTAGRVNRLEEEMVDLKVMVGTLESLLRSGAPASPATMTPAPPSISGGDSGELVSRVGALETQIAAVTAQLEQITRQLATLQSAPAVQPSLPLVPQNATPERQGAAPSASHPAFEEQNPGMQFRTTTIPEPRAPSGGSQTSGHAAWPESLTPLPSDVQSGIIQPQSLTAALPSSDAKALYEQGYGSFMERDYDKAESAFEEFIAASPGDPLAGNAQYWIGESYYQRGRYKDAADAFLKGYKDYRSNPKAADSLLKLGMSLSALGQKDAACSSFDELTKRFPAADEHVRETAADERKKAGC